MKHVLSSFLKKQIIVAGTTAVLLVANAWQPACLLVILSFRS